MDNDGYGSKMGDRGSREAQQRERVSTVISVRLIHVEAAGVMTEV